MSLPARASLAIALAWAGGFGSLGRLGGWGVALAGLVLIVAAWSAERQRAPHHDPRHDPPGANSTRGLARSLALALVMCLLARSLARVIIEVPASMWALPFVGLALASSRWPASSRPGRSVAAVTLVAALALLASLAGSRYELAAGQPRGMVHSGPIIGVHPRQAVAVRIDGFGPHDIVVDDFVDPPDGLGYDPSRWAERLELELHTIATTHYANGPARARQAFARAEVRVIDAIVPPAELAAYPSLLGVEVRSGSSGQGSTVEFGCPGQPTGPREQFETSRACPRKYLVDGSTGLGLSPRWPGYTQFIGRDRVRVARWFGWPGGDRRDQQTQLALESGVWLLMLVLGGWLVARRRLGAASGIARAAAVLGAVALVGVVLVAASRSGSAPGSWSDSGGLSLLAIALVLLPCSPSDPRGSRVMALACAASLVLLSASPLANHGDALALLEAVVEQLALGLGISWESSRALAGSLSVLALGAGVGICVDALLGPGKTSERRHTRELLLLGFVSALALALSLRKPGEDLALLHGAGALLIAATVRPRARAASLAVGLACAFGAALPLFGPVAPGPVVLVSLVLAALVCLGSCLGPERRLGPEPRLGSEPRLGPEPRDPPK